MGNLCYTELLIRADRQLLELLEQEFKRALSHEATNEHSETWLGHLLEHIGLSPDQFHCCGKVESHKLLKEGLFLSISSNWEPYIMCIEAFVKKYAPEAQIVYAAAEPMTELFWTNDTEHELMIDSSRYKYVALSDCF